VGLVAIAAAPDAEHQHHRHFQRRGQQPGPGGKVRRAAEEIHGHRSITLARTVGHQSDERTGVERLAHLEHQVHAAIRGVDRGHEASADVHIEHDAQRQVMPLDRADAHHLEAAEVRQKQQPAALPRDLHAAGAVVILDLEGIGAGEQEHPIQ
jgi:hypothetical protein